ncbi:MAG: hypothetical protein U0528_07585 [Anaerolineae bacterium]
MNRLQAGLKPLTAHQRWTDTAYSTGFSALLDCIPTVAKPYTVETRLVIAADGVESQVARWAGLKTVPSMANYYVGFQYLSQFWSCERSRCQYHIGQQLAPRLCGFSPNARIPPTSAGDQC